jgi:hypothetical protein
LTNPPMTREEIEALRARVGETLGHVILCKLRQMHRKLRNEHVQTQARGRAQRMIKEMRLIKSLLLADEPAGRPRRRRPLTKSRARTRSDT